MARLLATIVSFFAIAFFFSQSSVVTPSACAACDPTACCSCSLGYVDSDDDTYTVGSGVTVCYNPSAPDGYRTAPSDGPDCNDSNAAIGYIPAQSCPTGCGYGGGTVPDGNCGTITCPATPCCNPPTWYRDADGDSYGNPADSKAACSQPAGYVANSSDCYDSNDKANPAQTSYFTGNRGDGSFDYDCDGVVTANRSNYNWNSTQPGYSGSSCTACTAKHCNKSSVDDPSDRCGASTYYGCGCETYTTCPYLSSSSCAAKTKDATNKRDSTYCDGQATMKCQ